MEVILLMILGILALSLGGITILNILVLWDKNSKRRIGAFVCTYVIGTGLFVVLLLPLLSLPYWEQLIDTMSQHQLLSQSYMLTLWILAVPGYVFLPLLLFVPPKKMPPLVTSCGLFCVLLMNVLWIFTSIQMSDGILSEDGFYALFSWIYTGNMLLFSASTVKYQLTEQLKVIRERRMAAGNEPDTRLSGWLTSAVKTSGWLLAGLLLVVLVLEILLVLTGQGHEAPTKLFTDTAGWTFSQQIPPPPIEYEGHYLCTVAAVGHPRLVRPTRWGKRQGAVIVVNRQLCVANAFEDLLKEKWPRFHRWVRHTYDTLGFPVSRYINKAWKSDLVFLVMKPAEVLFLAVLYLLDADPEARIRRQYLYRA